MIRIRVEYSDRPGVVDVWPEEFGNRDEAVAYLREIARTGGYQVELAGPDAVALITARGTATATLLPDDGAATPTVLSLAALLAVAVLAVWTAVVPAAAVDGRGILAVAIATTVALTARARGHRRAVR